MQGLLQNAKRIIIKLGTNILRSRDGSIDQYRLGQIADQVALLKKRGLDVILVSSGAVGLGMGRLQIKRRPRRLEELQACAAIGQSILMKAWEESFDPHGIPVAQVLLTHDDVQGRRRHVSVLRTLEQLLSFSVVPIINENDTVSVDELKFGDNDLLSALVASLVKADFLAILSTIPGFMDLSTGMVIPLVEDINDEIMALAQGTNTETSVGGMTSKLEAAKVATKSGCGVFIGNGFQDGVLAELFSGAQMGTFFVPRDISMASRKRWIAFFSKPKGRLLIDAGACRALIRDGASLLPRGIHACEGDFSKGDVLDIVDEAGTLIARGLSQFSAGELKTFIGKSSEEILADQDSLRHAEAVHRDSLVLMG